MGRVWEERAQERELKKGIKRGLKRELTERAHRESSQRELTERARELTERAHRESSKRALRRGRQTLGVHSVGAMPWRGLLFRKLYRSLSK